MSDLATLQRLATTGDARAQCTLGARLLVGREAPYAPAEAHKWIDAAAAQNDADALHLLAALTALGEGRTQDWNKAHGFVARAAALGDAKARGLLQVLGDPFDPARWLQPPAPIARFETPRVATIEGFLPADACAWIIERARPKLEAARVKNPVQGGANTDSYRSNTGMGFSVVDTDLLLQIVHARIAAAIGVPTVHQEPTNVLHYMPGEQYRPHYDFLDPGQAHFHRELAQIGQRTITFLIYLNDAFEGGETAFPRLDWRFKGKTGDALVFWNVRPDGRPDTQTLHTGSPPTSGEKWLLSKWVRSRPVPLI